MGCGEVWVSTSSPLRFWVSEWASDRGCIIPAVLSMGTDWWGRWHRALDFASRFAHGRGHSHRPLCSKSPSKPEPPECFPEPWAPEDVKKPHCGLAGTHQVHKKYIGFRFERCSHPVQATLLWFSDDAWCTFREHPEWKTMACYCLHVPSAAG